MRRTWPHADTSDAVFLNRGGSRLSARSADEIIASIARAEPQISAAASPRTYCAIRLEPISCAPVSTSWPLPNSSVTLRVSLDSTRIYTLPTDDDLDAAIAGLSVDR